MPIETHMRIARTDVVTLITLGAVLVLPLGVLGILWRFPELDVVYRSADFHLLIATTAAAFTLVIAGVVAVPAVRSGQGSLVLMASASAQVGILLLGHGLTTPGVGAEVGANVWVARYPVIGLLVFALGQALAVRADGTAARLAARAPRTVLLAPLAASTTLVAVTALDPTALHGASRAAGELGVLHVLAVLAGTALVVVGGVHLRWHHLGGDRVQLLLAASCWISVMALVSLHVGELWHLSWWDYHAYLLAGFGAAMAAVVTSARRAQQADDALRGAFDPDPLRHLSSSYPEALHALVAAVEARDSYTHGHSERVAELAVRIGTRMRLPAATLRALAQGAYLHDVGKIGIPDAILNKNGPLDPEERSWIEQHPVVGAEIVRRAESLRHALAAVRHHHERFDGTGYPDGLRGTEIPLIARITSVADVWDALTSTRAYRPAWREEEALAHLLAGRGSQFDPTCVEAFVAHLREDRGVTTPVGPGEPAVLERVSHDCHDHDEDHAHDGAVAVRAAAVTRRWA